MKARRSAAAAGIALAVVATGLGVFAATETGAYDASLERVYDIPLPEVAPSVDDASRVARGKHVVDAIAGCSSADCHGADLAGGRTIEMGPVGRLTAPNITSGGLGAAYRDGELARLIREGVKMDGRSVRFMPVQDFRWLPDSDVAAIISYLRAAPAVDRPNGPVVVTALGKILDRRGVVVLDVARRIDHRTVDHPPPPSEGADYGQYLARSCTGCHGDHLSGGRIPGAPASLPAPANLTPDGNGLADWTYADFDRALRTGVRPDGKTIDPFMPTASFRLLDDTEKHALWAFLQTLPPRPYGQR